MAHDQSYLRIYGTIQLWNIDFHLLFSTFLHVYGPNNAQKHIRERKEKVIKWWWWWWEFATKSHQLMYACCISNKKKKRVNNKKQWVFFHWESKYKKKKYNNRSQYVFARNTHVEIHIFDDIKTMKMKSTEYLW